MSDFDPLARRNWIFDMDGTLTVAAHDFDAIRAELGLPAGEPILETLASMPSERARELTARLDEIELGIARRARAQAGAPELLQELKARGSRLGVLTRNSMPNVMETLAAAGLVEFFEPDFIVDRDAATPKPSPEGVNRLLHAWRTDPQEAVVVGDYVFDMIAGREAGAATVLIAREPTDDHATYADAVFSDLAELLLALSTRSDEY